jgi:hypothetical protein
MMCDNCHNVKKTQLGFMLGYDNVVKCTHGELLVII